MQDIIKIAKYFQEYGWLIKDVSKKIKNNLF